jgi:riboflavin synthase
LTAYDVFPALKGAIEFSVSIIPHTFHSTNFSFLKKGSIVNIEFDVLGKYIEKIWVGKI